MTNNSAVRRLQIAGFCVWASTTVIAWLVINLGERDNSSWFNFVYATVGAILVFWLGRTAAEGYGRTSFAGRGIELTAWAFVAWGLGNTIWFWYNTCTAWPILACQKAVDAPYPSIADVAYLSLPVLAAFGLWSFAKLLGVQLRDLARGIWLLILVGAGTSYFVAPTINLAGIDFGRGWLFDPSYTHTQQWLSSAYIVSDVLILTIALLLLNKSRRTAGGTLFAPLLCTSLSLICMYIGDMVFDHNQTHGSYFNGDLSDGLYALSYIFIVAAFALFERGRLKLSHGAPIT